MKIRRFLLFLPLLSLLVLATLYFLVDTWLGSAGGRRAVERALSDRTGLPFSLQGDFNIMLLPSVGVSGTKLLVGDPLNGGDLARSERYEVVLELRPLFREQLEIRQLTLADLKIMGDETGFDIAEIRLNAYAENKPTSFYLDLAGMGEVDGVFTWFPARLTVDLALDWSGTGEQAGKLSGQVAWKGSRFELNNLSAELDEQRVEGSGCVRLDAPARLDLLLNADVLDLDRITESLPDLPPSEGEFELPLEINLRLQAAELFRGDTSARGVVLEVGEPPSCAD